MNRQLSILLFSAIIATTNLACFRGDQNVKFGPALQKSLNSNSLNTPVDPPKAPTIPLTYVCSNYLTDSVGTNVIASSSLKMFLFKSKNGNMVPDDKAPVASSGDRAEVINKKQLSLPLNLPDGDYLPQVCDTSPGFQGSDCEGFERKKGSLGLSFEVIKVRAGKVTLSRPLRILYYKNDGNPEYPCDERQSPLVVDLDDTGIELSAPLSGAKFDIDGDGRRDRISWFKKSSNMFLALDRDGDGKISSVHELFGNNTIGPDGQKSLDGFDALRKYDSNHDKVIDSSDPVFKELRLWSDVNQDAKTDEGELKTLDELGVAEIMIPDTPYDKFEEDQYHNETRRRSIIKMKNGDVRRIVDIWFRIIPRRDRN